MMADGRFVVQEHTTTEGVHWDLMLENDDVLMTFRLEEEPAQALAHEVRAIKIFDHPLRFLTYEGAVQKGAASVRIVDAGTHRHRDHSEDSWALELNGRILKGNFLLVHRHDTEWRFALQAGPEQQQIP